MGLLGDTITLVKKDGTRHENVKASVQTRKVYIEEVSLPVEVGDKIIRRLPSGIEETLVVKDPGFVQGPGGSLAHYEIIYEREGVPKPEPQAKSVIYNVSGPHARVNVKSVDQSINVSSAQTGATFDQLRELLREHVADVEEHARLLDKVGELERAHGTAKFVERYKELMALAANHMTALAPVLPALSNLL